MATTSGGGERQRGGGRASGEKLRLTNSAAKIVNGSGDVSSRQRVSEMTFLLSHALAHDDDDGRDVCDGRRRRAAKTTASGNAAASDDAAAAMREVTTSNAAGRRYDLTFLFVVLGGCSLTRRPNDQVVVNRRSCSFEYEIEGGLK